MEIRQAIHPEHAAMLDTEELRSQFLVERLFENDKITMVYSHIDRIIVGGALPVTAECVLTASKELGVDFFLQRREMGIINIGAKGIVQVDDIAYELDTRECLYIGMGAKRVSFSGVGKQAGARFYFNSTPAHTNYPTRKLSLQDAPCLHLGSDDAVNRRSVYQLIHPAVLKTCQLVMGLTILEPRNVWNTMPCHTHDRRMEVYFYFNLAEDALVFHMLGEPGETRHVVVRNEQAVISPSWSIHSGVGTGSYMFVWSMAGENQTFTDTDAVPFAELM